MIKKRKPTTLIEIAVARHGFRRGMTVVSFVVAWGIARELWAEDHPGDPFTIEEYATWWKISRSTAYREQAWFREAFPNEVTPDRFTDLALSQRIQVGKLRLA